MTFVSFMFAAAVAGTVLPDGGGNTGVLLVGILLVAPFWGLSSPWLFFRGWLALLGVAACLIGAVRGQRPRSLLLWRASAFLTAAAFFLALLFWGFYGLYRLLPFGHNNAEVLVYWLFCTIQLLVLLPAAPARLDELLANCLEKGLNEADEN